MASRVIETYRDDLYYYVNGEAQLVAEGVSGYAESYDMIMIDSETTLPIPVLYDKYEREELNRIKMSEITNVYQIEDHYYSAGGNYETCLASGGREFELDLADDEYLYSNCYLDAANNMLYAIVGVENEDGDSDLYSIDLDTSKLGEMTELDDEVDQICGAQNGYVYYMKDIDYSDVQFGDLYCNGEELLSDVYPYLMQVSDEGKAVYCYTDYEYTSGSNNVGTLMYVTANDEKEIAEDISEFAQIGNGNLLLLENYDYNAGGDLLYYDGKELHDVERDVFTVFISNFTNK